MSDQQVPVPITASRGFFTVPPLSKLMPWALVAAFALALTGCTANPQVFLPSVETPSDAKDAPFVLNAYGLNLGSGHYSLSLTADYCEPSGGSLTSSTPPQIVPQGFHTCSGRQMLQLPDASLVAVQIQEIPQLGLGKPCKCTSGSCRGTVLIQLHDDDKGIFVSGPHTDMVVSWKGSGGTNDMTVRPHVNPSLQNHFLLGLLKVNCLEDPSSWYK